MFNNVNMQGGGGVEGKGTTIRVVVSGNCSLHKQHIITQVVVDVNTLTQLTVSSPKFLEVLNLERQLCPQRRSVFVLAGGG